MIFLAQIAANRVGEKSYNRMIYETMTVITRRFDAEASIYPQLHTYFIKLIHIFQKL